MSTESAPASHAAGHNSGRPAQAVPPRILVVDDEAPLRALIGEILVRAGFRVEFAENGAAAIQKVKTGAPDLMTLDLMMPGVTGWEVIEQIRGIPGAPPVVLVSGSTETLRERHPLRECVAGVVYKPFHPRELVNTCEKVLRDREKPGMTVVVERRRLPRRLLALWRLGAQPVEDEGSMKEPQALRRCVKVEPTPLTHR